jgi:hypothetical protein
LPAVRSGRRAAIDDERGVIVDDARDRLLSRRRMLQVGALAVASIALPESSAAAARRRLRAGPKTAQPARRAIRTGYRRARFEPHVGTTVKLRPPGGAALRVKLVGVEDVANVPSLASAQDAYVLRFRGPTARPLAEGIVAVRHPRFGTLRLYISAAPADGPNRDYLAVVNRRIPRRARRRRM